MKKEERKQGFWLYTIVGLVFGIGGAAAGYFTHVGSRFDRPNPAHAAFVQHRAEYRQLVATYNRLVVERNTWNEAHREDGLQRQFEEVLAGVRPAPEIADQYTRHVAYELRPASFGADPRHQMQNTIWLLTANGDGRNHAKVFSVLSDEDRLTRLLNGDQSAIVPRYVANTDPIAWVPAFTEHEPSIWIQYRPPWYRGLYAGAVSLLFSIGFCLSGLIARIVGEEQRYGNNENAWERPLATRPASVVGFLLWLIGLPGFLFFGFVKFLFTDLHPLLRRLFGKEFQSELDRQLAKLGALKERATKLANKEMLTQIESTEQRIRVAANSQELSGLANELDDVKNHLDGIVEADSVVGRSSKTPAGG
jgi:hypothetical protein